MNPRISIPMVVDVFNQWFVDVWLVMNGKMRSVRFKVDTGCNALLLNHDTMERFGLTVSREALSMLPSIPGALASGDTHMFKKLGKVSLFRDNKRVTPICDADAICHSAKETNNLLGTVVLRQFVGVAFGLGSKTSMELLR